MLRYFIHSFIRSASRTAYFTTVRPLLLHGSYHQPAHAILLCQRLTPTGGTGISTSCPSPTTFVLGLGPDLPWADEPSPGNLRFSAGRILTCLIVYSYRHSHFPTLQHSLRYTFAALGTLPYRSHMRSLDFGDVLEPRYIFGAGALDQ